MSSSLYELIQACERGDAQAVDLLLDEDIGADPNGRYRSGHSYAGSTDLTPLGAALKGAHIDIVKKLLAAGADPTGGYGEEDGEDRTPLKTALRNGQTKILQLFFSHIKSKGITMPDGLLLYTLTCYYPEELEEAILLLLNEVDCDVDARSEGGLPVLHLAVGLNFVAVVEKLIALNADVEAVDGSNKDAVTCALESSSDGKIIAMLIAAGVSVNPELEQQYADYGLGDDAELASFGR